MPLAAGVVNSTFQLPLLSALVTIAILVHSGSTITFSPGVAQPQRVTVDFCCNTILSVIIEGNLISAKTWLIGSSRAKSASFFA
jgi:hypothetical protein